MLPAVGTRYENRKRKGQLVQVEGVEGDTRDALVALLFVRSGQRWRTPLWLFNASYRRDLKGPLEKGAQ